MPRLRSLVDPTAFCTLRAVARGSAVFRGRAAGRRCRLVTVPIVADGAAAWRAERKPREYVFLLGFGTRPTPRRRAA